MASVTEADLADDSFGRSINGLLRFCVHGRHPPRRVTFLLQRGLVTSQCFLYNYLFIEGRDGRRLNHIEITLNYDVRHRRPSPFPRWMEDAGAKGNGGPADPDESAISSLLPHVPPARPCPQLRRGRPFLPQRRQTVGSPAPACWRKAQRRRCVWVTLPFSWRATCR